MKPKSSSEIRSPHALLLSRRTLFSVPGGDTIQIVKTAAALRSQGWVADVSIELNPEMSGYDIVHIFNITRPQEAYLHTIKARALNIPVVLSPIYVDYREFDRNGRKAMHRIASQIFPSSMLEYLKVAARACLNNEMHRGTALVLTKGYRSLQRMMLEHVSLLLPNSESEMRRLTRDFPEANAHRYEVIPNSVDSECFNAATTEPAHEFRDCVLCVGRIEGRKGQLSLVRALKGTGLKLALIGKPAPNHTKYYDQIRSEAGPDVHILGEIAHDDLPRYYAACKVHALVSWMETTGLSSLEAAAMGANIVITDRGDTREYFGNHAYYCSPGSVDSIKSAILAAHSAPRATALRDMILKRYTWNVTASGTIAAYRQLLEHQI